MDCSTTYFDAVIAPGYYDIIAYMNYMPLGAKGLPIAAHTYAMMYILMFVIGDIVSDMLIMPVPESSNLESRIASQW